MVRKTGLAIILMMGMIIVLSGCSLLASDEKIKVPATELIRNGSFEELDDTGFPAGYRATHLGSAGEVAADSSRARSGQRSVKITTDEATLPRLNYDVNISGGGTFRATVYFQTDDGTTAENIRMRFMAFSKHPANEANKIPWQADWLHEIEGNWTTGVAAGNAFVDPTHTDSGTEWSRLEMEFTVPEEVRVLVIDLFNRGDVGHSGSVWYDDLSLLQLD